MNLFLFAEKKSLKYVYCGKDNTYLADGLDLVKSRSREIGCYKDRVALKFGRHFGSTAAQVPVKIKSD